MILNNKSFSLIELLVTITIIAVIAAMVTPVFGRAREMARRANCASNLRQAGIAFQLYADEHDEALPYSDLGPWYSMIYPSYADNQNIFFCPTERLSGAVSDTNISYGYNGSFYVRGPQGPVKLSMLENPVSTILLADSRTGSLTKSAVYGNISFAPWVWPSDRHSTGSNVFFIDGHVRWHTVQELVDIHGVGGSGECWWDTQ